MTERLILTPDTDVLEDHPNVVKVFAAGVASAVIAKIVWDKVRQTRRLKERVAELENELSFAE